MPPPLRGTFPSLRTSPSKQRDEPVASTSRLPIVKERQGRRRKSSRTSDETCWCTNKGDKRPAAAATVALAVLLAPLANASPLSPLSPRQTGKQRAVDIPALSSPTPAPRPARLVKAEASPPESLDRASPSALIAQRPAALQKRLLDKWEFIDGEWTLNSWTLRGRVAGAPTSAIEALAPIEDSTSSIRASALQDNLDVLPSTSIGASPSTRTSLNLTATGGVPLASSTRPATTVAPHGTPKIAAAASPSDFTIPSGWASTPRETNFYAVPVIVSMSVLVSIAVVGTVLLSVVWRKKARVKRNKEGEAEKGRMGRMMEKVGLGGISEKKKGRKSKGKKGGKKGGGASGGVGGEGTAAAGLARVDTRVSSDLGSGSGGGRRAITRANSSALPAAGRVRPRRRRARPPQSERDDDEEEEARSALTGSQPATVPETLTSRLQSRLRRGSTTPIASAGPSTVFSRDLERTSTHSTYSSNGHLSRTSSRTPSIVDETASRLGQPLDHDNPLTLSRSSSRRSLAASIPAPASPALSTNSATSAFGSTFLDVPLPALGPPAYRPASSTVQSTTRHSIARVPVPRVEVEEREAPVARLSSTRAAQDEQWHWPNEKPAATAPSTSRRAARRRVLAAAPPPTEQPEEPPVDPSLYSAHLATDDKAVLARLREQASSPARRSRLSSTSQLPEASAPAQEDDDVDEEGFERMPLAGPSGVTHPTPSAPPPSTSSSVLPAPPRPVDFAFDYTSSSSPSSALDNDRKTSVGPSGTSRRRAAMEEEQEETTFLPVYHARERILQMASAPPPDEEDVEQEDVDRDGAAWAEVAEEQDRARWEDREEQAEV